MNGFDSFWMNLDFLIHFYCSTPQFLHRPLSFREVVTPLVRYEITSVALNVHI